jgi:hypothetical protein
MDIILVYLVLVASFSWRTDGFFYLYDFCGYLIWSPVFPDSSFSQLSLINYTVDAYLFAAASALAASTVSRSIFGAAFTVRPKFTPFSTASYSSPLQLFARQMFDSMNPRWASTLLGFIAAAMIPIPIVLRRYGPYLRSKSRFIPNTPPVKPETSAV